MSARTLSPVAVLAARSAPPPHHAEAAAERASLRVRDVGTSPQAPDAERAVLALAMQGRADLPVLSGGPDAFLGQGHARIARAVLRLAAEGVPVDLVSVCESLRGAGELAGSTSAAAVSEIYAAHAIEAQGEHYASIVAERLALRRIAEACVLARQLALEPGSDPVDIAGRLALTLGEIAGEGQGAAGLVPVADLLPGYMEGLMGARPEPITTGLAQLNEILRGGLRGGRLYVVAGRAGMGKSAFAYGLLRASAGRGYESAFFSLEMPSDEILDRAIAFEARMSADDVERYRDGDEHIVEAVERAAGRLRTLPIHLDASSGLTVEVIAARVRLLKAKCLREGKRLGVVVVDYTQLVTGRGAERRTEEIASVTRALKALAKEVDAPVVALSQISRAAEQGNNRPKLSHLAESSSIENDADCVLMLYRAEYYGEMVDDKLRSTEGVAEVIVGKQRRGPTGVARVAFIGKWTRFDNLAPEEGAYGSDASYSRAPRADGPAPEDF